MLNIAALDKISDGEGLRYMLSLHEMLVSNFMIIVNISKPFSYHTSASKLLHLYIVHR